MVGEGGLESDGARGRDAAIEIAGSTFTDMGPASGRPLTRGRCAGATVVVDRRWHRRLYKGADSQGQYLPTG